MESNTVITATVLSCLGRITSSRALVTTVADMLTTGGCGFKGRIALNEELAFILLSSCSGSESVLSVSSLFLDMFFVSFGDWKVCHNESLPYLIFALSI